jgi:hypothetical protein
VRSAEVIDQTDLTALLDNVRFRRKTRSGVPVPAKSPFDPIETSAMHRGSMKHGSNIKGRVMKADGVVADFVELEGSA